MLCRLPGISGSFVCICQEWALDSAQVAGKHAPRSTLHEGPANWSRVGPHLGPGSWGMTFSERLAREACQSTIGSHLCLRSLFLSKCFKGNQETGWQPHEVFEFMATKVFGEPMKPRAVFSDVVGIPSPILHQALNRPWGAVRGKFRNGHPKTDF